MLINLSKEERRRYYLLLLFPMFIAHMNAIRVLGLKNGATYLTAVPKATLTVLCLNMISQVGRLGLVITLRALPLASSE